MTNRTFKKVAVGTSDFLRERCLSISNRLRSERDSRVRTRQHNFDSGIPLEETFRIELGRLIAPYQVDVGRVVDRDGFTAGECDLVILDPTLAPLLLPGAEETSRNKWFAFEATYGIVEVKQTLTLGATDEQGRLAENPKGSLWDACEKIFAFKQLARTFDGPISYGIKEALGYAFFYGSESALESDEERDQLLREVITINSLVEPAARVNGIFVLDKCAVTWSFLADPETRTFTTLQHLTESPAPVWVTLHPTGLDTLYWFFTQLWSVLARTQLGAPDLLKDYGGAALKSKDIRAMTASIGALLESAAVARP